jgi:hypothetical protein
VLLAFQALIEAHTLAQGKKVGVLVAFSLQEII